jgi:hypothetical protein
MRPPINPYLIGIRVEWFRSRERSRRWDEEVHWLQCEVSTVILDYNQRAIIWRERGAHAGLGGAVPYAFRQAAMWTEMRDDARVRTARIIQVQSFQWSITKLTMSIR